MGNSSSTSIRNFQITIVTTNGRTFIISYHSFVEHILLLRKVINHPEIRKEGPLLDSFIQDYCKRMTTGEMKTADQQFLLPWQIEWIWHVHRLHPIDYLNDCSTQFSGELVDKKAIKLIHNDTKKTKSKTRFSPPKNFLSIDLTSVILRQNVFLDKFQKHFLYSYDLNRLNELIFHNLVQDYVSFIKLARKDEMIVPTFDIDLIWHTHMRFPLHYQEFSKALCGFILDNNDSIETYILTDAYQITADRWRQTYRSEYGKHIDGKHLPTSGYISPGTIVDDSVFVSSTIERPIRSTFQDGHRSRFGYAGNTYGGKRRGRYGGDFTVPIEQNLSEFNIFSY